MKFKELKEKGKEIKWGLIPPSKSIREDIQDEIGENEIKEIIQKRSGCYFYIGVWNLRPHLAVCEIYPDLGGGERSKIIEDPPISDEKMIGAIYAVGGTINSPGLYPLSGDLIKELETAISGLYSTSE